MLSLIFGLLISSNCSEALTKAQVQFQQNNARLFETLFSGYQRSMSPYNGHGAANPYNLSTIALKLQYARLIRVIEPELQHQNLIGLVLEWSDPRLEWNPADYGGIDHIYTNRYQVWMPEFHACESSQSAPVSQEQNQNIRLNASGYMNAFVIYSSIYSCEFDTSLFPFDSHHCYYCFLLYNYNSKDELRFKSSLTARPYIYGTSEWSIKMREQKYIDSLDVDFNMGLLYFNITLRRRPEFYIGLVITPTFVIGSLILIGLFFGSAENLVNNAVGLGLTTMMSMMVIVGILAEALAKSQNIPVLGWYIIIEILIITLAVISLLASKALCKVGNTIVSTCCEEGKGNGCIETVKTFLRSKLLHRCNSYLLLFTFFFSLHVINIAWLFGWSHGD